MLLSLWWWPISDVGDRIIMLATFFVMLVIFSMYKIGHQHFESVTNILNWSPTHLVSKIRHQHQCNHNDLNDLKRSNMIYVQYSWMNLNVHFCIWRTVWQMKTQNTSHYVKWMIHLDQVRSILIHFSMILGTGSKMILPGSVVRWGYGWCCG